MIQHNLLIISNRGYIYKNIYPSYHIEDMIWQTQEFQCSYVVNCADPKAKIKHIIDCAKYLYET